jgi:hypothetical protein
LRSKVLDYLDEKLSEPIKGDDEYYFGRRWRVASTEVPSEYPLLTGDTPVAHIRQIRADPRPILHR